MINDISAASIGQQPGMSQQAIGNTGNTGMGSGMGMILWYGAKWRWEPLEVVDKWLDKWVDR